MSGFRVELGLVLTASLLFSAAAAQTGSGSEPASSPANLPVPAAQAPSPPSSGIEVTTLGEPDGPPAGLLDDAHGGMAGDIWTGSPRNLIEDLLSHVPLATPVRSVRTLARKLILTTAEAPVGQAAHAFQTVRLDTLLNAGLVTDAARLAVQIRIKDDPEFARLQAQAILLGGGPGDACTAATSARETNPEPLWMQLRTYCYAAAGENDLFDLTRGVMKAQRADDRAFEILVEDVLKHKANPPGELHEPTAVEVFLLKQAGLPISSSLAAKFGLAASRLAFEDAKNSTAVRADAAAQVLHTGWVPFVELDGLADALAFTPRQLANAETAAAGLPFFYGQAFVRQAVARASDNSDRARLLNVALRVGRQSQLLPIAAGLQENGLAAIAPSPSLHAYVRAFARALLFDRKADAAERWRESIDPENLADRPLAAALAVELDLVAPNPGRNQRAMEALAWLGQYAASPEAANDPDMQRYGALAVVLFDALGEPLPAGVSAAPVLASRWPGRALSPAVRKRLDELKGQPDRKGEAILTVLDTVGVLGPGDLSPEAAAFLVRTLKAEGETEAARALAGDALLLYQSTS